jgi:hypothetical protein
MDNLKQLGCSGMGSGLAQLFHDHPTLFGVSLKSVSSHLHCPPYY